MCLDRDSSSIASKAAAGGGTHTLVDCSYVGIQTLLGLTTPQNIPCPECIIRQVLTHGDRMDPTSLSNFPDRVIDQ